MIYIASPYSSPDRWVMESRFEAVYAYTRTLMHAGRVCFSPIVYGHQFHLRQDAPPNYEWWQAFNEEVLLRSSELHVLRLNAWQISRGVRHEIAFAERHGLPLKYVDWHNEDF